MIDMKDDVNRMLRRKRILRNIAWACVMAYWLTDIFCCATERAVVNDFAFSAVVNITQAAGTIALILLLHNRQ